jgi:hypothetical protein
MRRRRLGAWLPVAAYQRTRGSGGPSGERPLLCSAEGLAIHGRTRPDSQITVIPTSSIERVRQPLFERMNGTDSVDSG